MSATRSNGRSESNELTLGMAITPRKGELPPELTIGTSLVTHTGCKVTVARIKERYMDADLLYSLRYESGIIGHRQWTRDELDAEGCVLDLEETTP